MKEIYLLIPLLTTNRSHFVTHTTSRNLFLSQLCPLAASNIRSISSKTENMQLRSIALVCPLFIQILAIKTLFISSNKKIVYKVKSKSLKKQSSSTSGSPRKTRFKWTTSILWWRKPSSTRKSRRRIKNWRSFCKISCKIHRKSERRPKKQWKFWDNNSIP